MKNPNKFKLSILIVSYNSERFIEDCLQSIEQSLAHVSSNTVEILLYEAGSTDMSTKLIHDHITKFPNTHIQIFAGANLGFAGANNFLALKSTGRYLFFLNPDTKLDPPALKNLINKIDDDKAIYIPKQISFEGKFISLGVGLDIFGYPHGSQKVFYADGAALVISRVFFNDLGGFDKDYFMFYEDVDLSWRARLKNATFIQIPECVVYHFGGGSLQGGFIKEQTYTTNIKRRYLGERNCLNNFVKNYNVTTLLILLPMYLAINIAEMVIFLLTRRGYFIKSYVKAWVWNIKNISSTLKKRKVIQASRAVGDLEIIKKMYLGSYKFKLLTEIGVPKTTGMG